jgi:hypothetical protein
VTVAAGSIRTNRTTAKQPVKTSGGIGAMSETATPGV